MALTFTYNGTLINIEDLYRATSGGTVFSANLASSTAFDYFDDTAVANDAIYFSGGVNMGDTSDLSFTIGTAISATNLVLAWEYYKRGVGWTAIEDLQDDTAGFTITGVNRVRFPLQWQITFVTINALSRIWFRCRIVSLTAITEGGANITTVVKRSNGKLSVAGGTDAVPATLTDFYNYMVTNYPYVHITKRTVNSFDFTKIAFCADSRVFSKNEILELGQDCSDNANVGGSNFYYLTCGIKTGDKGYSGSTIILHGSPNSSIAYASAYTKMYGTIVKTGKTRSDSNGFAGYVTLNGEWIDCFLEISIFMPGVGQIVQNTRMVGSLVINSGAVGTFDGVYYLCVASQLFYLYQTGSTINNLGYRFLLTSGAYLFNLYQSSPAFTNPEWILVNPSTPLTTLADANKPISFSNNNTLDYFGAVKWYDASAGTYTNYKTQADNATIDDVPLGGDVGDYLLFGMLFNWGVSTGVCFDWTITPQSNDYEYIYEYYRNGTWYPFTMGYISDMTNNLSQSGRRYASFPNSTPPTSVAIDGYTGYWTRLRIVTKGTGSPTASKILPLYNSGCSLWSIKEKYSFDLKVLDPLGVPVASATVTATDSLGAQIFSVTTDVNGDIAQQLLIAKEYHFDAVNFPTTCLSENIFSTFSFTISKTGYETYSSLGVDLGGQVTLAVVLKPIKSIRTTIEGKFLLANKPELGSSAKMVEL